MRRLTVTGVLAGFVIAALAGSGSPVVYAAHSARAPTTVGLVLHYRFDDDVGVVARDASSNSIHGTYVDTTAAAARSSGVPGRSWAITLVGAEKQYISVPERDPLDVDRFTVAALIRYTGIENDQTFGRWEVVEKAGAYWINVRTDGRVRVGGFFGRCTSAGWKYLDSDVVVAPNVWTHVAATYNGSTLTVWIDGSPAGRMAVGGRTCRNNLPLAVGAKNNPAKGLLEAFWDGQLDDVRIYRRALSATEIRALLPG